MTHHFIQSKMHEMISFLPVGSIKTSYQGEAEGKTNPFVSQVRNEFQNGVFAECPLPVVHLFWQET